MGSGRMWVGKQSPTDCKGKQPVGSAGWLALSSG